MKELLPLLACIAVVLLNMGAFYAFYRWGRKDGKNEMKKRIRAFKGMMFRPSDELILEAIENEVEL